MTKPTVTLPTQDVQDLLKLMLGMGNVIRFLDESADHSVMWLQDGDYIAHPAYTAVAEALEIADQQTQKKETP